MKVQFRGWRRYINNYTLANEDISRTEADDESNTGVEIKKDGDDVLLQWMARGLNLHGDYEATVRLSRAEITNLARISLRDELFGEVVQALAKLERRSKI